MQYNLITVENGSFSINYNDFFLICLHGLKIVLIAQNERRKNDLLGYTVVYRDREFDDFDYNWLENKIKTIDFVSF